MPDNLTSILDALEKPLNFASKSNYSNIDKIKALDQHVLDLTLKALSLPLNSGEYKTIDTMRSLFEEYESLDKKQKIKVIQTSLSIIEKLKGINKSKAGTTKKSTIVKPEKIKKDMQNELVSDKQLESPRQFGHISEIPLQFVKGVGPRIASILKKKDIETVEDALNYFPRAYEDSRGADL